jgi:uncharacterized protein
VVKPAQTRPLRLARAVVVAYLAAALMLLTFQRSILFPAPSPTAISPSAGTLLEGRSAGGRRVVALWSPTRPEAPTVAFFHGNGAQLSDSADLAPFFHAEGWNVFAVEYPGYGPLADDSPSEESLLDVADGAMALLRTRLSVPVERTVLIGQSLGTGVATALAARGAGSKLILISPFRSIPAVAREHFWFLPVNLLVRDRFDSEARAPSVTIPALVIHGTDDEVIPFAHGVEMARRLPHGTLVRIARAHHNDLWSDFASELRAAMRAFITAR